MMIRESVVLLLLITFSNKYIAWAARSGNEILLRNPEDCGSYFKLRDGDIIKLSCSGGLHWNDKYKFCDEPEFANCVTDNCTENFFSPNEHDCQSYYHCIDGEQVLTQCQGGMYWNDKYKTCDWPENTECQVSTTTTENILSTSTESPSATTVDPATTPGYQNSTTQSTETERPTVTTNASQTTPENPTTQSPNTEKTTTTLPQTNFTSTIAGDPNSTIQSTETERPTVTTTANQTTPENPTSQSPNTEKPTTTLSQTNFTSTVAGDPNSTTQSSETEKPTTESQSSTAPADPTTQSPNTEKPTTMYIETTSTQINFTNTVPGNQNSTTQSPVTETPTTKDALTTVTETTQSQGTEKLTTEGTATTEITISTSPNGTIPTTTRVPETDKPTTKNTLTTVTETEITTTESQSTTEETTMTSTQGTEGSTPEDTTRTSTEEGSSETVPPETCSHGELLPNKDDCETFYQCVYGQKIMKTCPIGLHWNNVLKVCDWPNSAGCNSEQTCIQGENLPNPENCESFYQCVHNVLVKHTCPDRLHWSQELNTCTWPHLAKCAISSTENISEEELNNSNESSSEQLSNEHCTHGEYYPNTKDCRYFRQCSHGILYDHQCPKGLHWNTNLNVCDWPLNANCKINSEDETDSDESEQKPIPSISETLKNILDKFKTN